MAYSRIAPGSEITITDHVYFVREQGSLVELVKLPPDTLEEMQQSSIAQETAIYEKLCASTDEWAKQANKTLLLMKAIEHLKTPAVAHTSNRWIEDEYGRHEVSNMVYTMTWRVYEDTKWDRAAQKSIPVAWDLSWGVYFNTPHNPDDSGQGRTIAGQERKRFTDKAGMEKYLQGRIAAYAHLFTERSPHIPEEHQRRFCVNGELLHGYTVQTPETLEPDKVVVDALLACLDDGDIGDGTLVDTAPKKAFDKKPAHTTQKKQTPTR